ncbi:MAG: hypothetical protein JWN44_2429 [Myxococcales bacterium]|nr:hypothetical protein [Myxococcales bacterium]
MNRRTLQLVGVALIALPLAWSPTARAQRVTGVAGSTSSATTGTGPAGSTGAGANGSTTTTANGSNSGVGNSSGIAASQGTPHAGHRKVNPKPGESTR